MPSGHSVSCLCHLPGNSYRNDIPMIFAGILDITSNYNSLDGVPGALTGFFERLSYKMGGKLKKRRKIYGFGEHIY